MVFSDTLRGRVVCDEIAMLILSLGHRSSYLALFQKQVYFWLPAQAFNFVLLPTRFRVLYVGACSFLWLNLLCWIKRSPVSEEERTSG